MNLYIEFILIVIIVFIWFGWKTWEKSSRKKLIKEYDIKKDMSAEVQKKYVEPLRLDHNGNNEKGGIFNNGGTSNPEPRIDKELDSSPGPEQSEGGMLLSPTDINVTGENSKLPGKNGPRIRRRFFRRRKER